MSLESLRLELDRIERKLRRKSRKKTADEAAERKRIARRAYIAELHLAAVRNETPSEIAASIKGYQRRIENAQKDIIIFEQHIRSLQYRADHRHEVLAAATEKLSLAQARLAEYDASQGEIKKIEETNNQKQKLLAMFSQYSQMTKELDEQQMNDLRMIHGNED